MIEKEKLLELIASARQRQEIEERQILALEESMAAHKASFKFACGEVEALTKLRDLWHPEPPPDVPF
ncbi:MAG TPA: hypothetical protein VMG10_10690 [Gemmataceae bacterium]|nr:hypothetical protein [Gemmataceae bacterium]